MSEINFMGLSNNMFYYVIYIYVLLYILFNSRTKYYNFYKININK